MIELYYFFFFRLILHHNFSQGKFKYYLVFYHSSYYDLNYECNKINELIKIMR